MGCPGPSNPDGGVGGGSGGSGGATGGGSGGATGGGSGGATGGGSGGATGGGSGGATGGGSGGATGGGSGGATGGGSGGATGGGAAGPVLAGPDRSTPIALTTDDTILVVANPDNNTVSIFNTATRMRSTVINTGANSQPVSVSIHPNNTTAFVLLRQAQQLIKITGINNITPTIDAMRATVGSEPTGVALSPTGATAVVANFGEDRVSFVDTATMAVTHATVGPNPRAIAITNNGDMSDADETAYVTLFYGTPSAEASDTGRTGKVIPIPMGTRTPGNAINLAPIADTGFQVDGGAVGVACSPNQLFGIAINNGRGYVTHVCASPRGPVNPLTNLFAGVSVFDIPGNSENTSATGSVALSRLVREQEPTNVASLLGVPIAIDFKTSAGNGVAYLVSQAADVVQRLDYSGASIRLGNTGAFNQINIAVNGGGAPNSTKVPIGLVAAHTTASLLYVHNWVDRSVTIVNLAGQAVDTVMRSEALPAANTPEEAVLRGKRFYFTGTGRWATRGVNSCGSCHPDGLSDNLTWVFAAGPRQTTPMDGTFAKTNGEQRALNWTAIFDEVHDFELNTRGTAGGVGALVHNVALTPASRLDMTVAFSADGGLVPPGNFTRNDFLSGSARNLSLARSVLPFEWDEINDFSKTIRANRKPSNLVAADVTAGQALFMQGKCMNCHGGPKWTVSRVSYVPSPEKNGTVAPSFTDAGIPVAANGLRTQALTLTAAALPAPNNMNIDANKVSTERLTDGGTVGPERITCVLRRVGTFSAANTIEKKADSSQAQGENGFNPPSLLGMFTSAPYFHAGSALTLTDLLMNVSFAQHLRAGDANFNVNATQAGQLAAFLNSIDDTTTVIPPEANTDTCTGY